MSFMRLVCFKVDSVRRKLSSCLRMVAQNSAIFTAWAKYDFLPTESQRYSSRFGRSCAGRASFKNDLPTMKVSITSPGEFDRHEGEVRFLAAVNGESVSVSITAYALFIIGE